MRAILLSLALLIVITSAEPTFCSKTETAMDCWMRSGVWPFTNPPSLYDLASLNAKYYDTLWEYYTVPQTTIESFQGRRFTGIIMEVEKCAAGEAALNVLVGDVFHTTPYSRVLSFEKRFYSHTYNNISGETYWPLEDSAAIKGSGQSLKIDYSIPENNIITRPLIDEVRWIKGPQLSLWFGLQWTPMP